MAVTYLTLYLAGQELQVVEGSQLHLIYASMGATASPSAPGQAVRADPFPQYVDGDELAEALAGLGSVGGGGGTAYTDEQVRDVVSAMLVEGPNVTLTKDDDADRVTISATGGGETAPTLDNIPAGSTLTVQKSGGTWPARPTARADVFVQWKGPDPSPAVVSSGTGGMRDGIDTRFVTP